MCTSIVSNIGKTVVGWNLDILDMEDRVRPTSDGVYIEINDKTEGWMPLFGANRRGEFVSMPCCWPYDSRSDMKDGGMCIINLDIDLLLMKKTFAEVREIAESGEICSIPSTTFQAQLSDADGNVHYYKTQEAMDVGIHTYNAAIGNRLSFGLQHVKYHDDGYILP